MSTPTIDYDALAAQHGGSAAVDYDALAAQHGGTTASAPAPDWRDKYTTLELHGTSHTGIAPVDAGITALSNIGAGGLGAILHPVDTLKSFGDAINPANIGNPIAAAQQFAPLVEGLMTHPAETVEQGLGQSAVMGAAGKAAPVVAGAVADAVSSTAGKLAPRLYSSALKPSTVLSPAERAGAIQTGLQEGIPVSKEGLEQLGNKIDALNQSIKGEIGADPTRPIDPNAVATRADMAKAKFYNQVNAQPDLNAIEASKQQFLAEQGAQPGQPGTPPQPTGVLNAQGQPIMSQGTPATPAQPAPPMAAADAQAMKQGTYRVLAGKFGEQGSASVEAQKALARGLKEEIAGQFPELANLNAQESKLLDLQPLLERAVNRISNHQLVGIGTPIAGGAAKAVTGSTPLGVIASVLKAAVDDPMIKSRLAIALSKSAQIPYSTALSRVGAYSSNLGATVGGSLASPSGASPNQSPSGQP